MSDRRLPADDQGIRKHLVPLCVAQRGQLHADENYRPEMEIEVALMFPTELDRFVRVANDLYRTSGSGLTLTIPV